MELLEYQISTPWGPLYLWVSPKGLRKISWKPHSTRKVRDVEQNKSVSEIFDTARVQLLEYFSGQRKRFDLRLDLEGTLFQKKVWDELQSIPFGQTVAYRDVALRINHPNAYRAVGTANSHNPLCIVVPCHRVISADGSIGGYAGGIRIKQKLLDLERQI